MIENNCKIYDEEICKKIKPSYFFPMKGDESDYQYWGSKDTKDSLKNRMSRIFNEITRSNFKSMVFFSHSHFIREFFKYHVLSLKNHIKTNSYVPPHLENGAIMKLEILKGKCYASWNTINGFLLDNGKTINIQFPKMLIKSIDITKSTKNAIELNPEIDDEKLEEKLKEFYEKSVFKSDNKQEKVFLDKDYKKLFDF